MNLQLHLRPPLPPNSLLLKPPVIAPKKDPANMPIRTINPIITNPTIARNLAQRAASVRWAFAAGSIPNPNNEVV